MDWSSWAALGSILGGAFTGLAFFATLFLLMREVRIRRADKEDEYARQARLIISEVTGKTSDGSGKLNLEGKISNYSDMPIFNLWVTMGNVRDGHDGFRILPPGSSVEARFSVRQKDDDGKPGRNGSPREDVNLHFLDANGRHWHRRGSGQPLRILKEALSEKAPLESYKP